MKMKKEKRGKDRRSRGKRGKRDKTPIIVISIIVAIFVFMIIIISISKDNLSRGNNVALIHIDGTILVADSQSFIPYSATYSDKVITFIEDAIKNKNIKAIIFEINSPGGSAVASSEIAEAIKKVKEHNKTTVALIREQGTSGAYWVASACDYVITHPLSITGSIGVIASYLEISGLLESYNITYEKLTAGKYKDVMSPFRELTQEEREMIQNKLDIIYKAFVEEVAKNRNLSEEQTRELATGMFYLGKEAKDLRLVDFLGTKEDAINYIEKQCNITAKIKEYKKEKGLLDIFSRLQSQGSFWLGRGIGASFIDQNLMSSLKIVT